MRTIAIASAKGGVGKTTLAVHLAVAAVQQGRDVVLVDADPQLSAVRWSERRSSPGPVVLGRAVSQLAAEMERISGFGADVAIVDTPPRAWVGADNAALVAAKLADVVLVPCRPSIFDIESTAVSVQRLQAATAAPVVVVLNGCAHRGREADEAAEALGGLGAQVCPVRIGQRVAFARSLLDGRAAQEVEPGGKAADDVLRVHTFCMRTRRRGR